MPRPLATKAARASLRLVALLATVLGCNPGGDGEQTGTRADLIVGGQVATMYPEAAYLNIDFTASGGVVCSAALIAPQVVLTAGHCVDGHSKWTVVVGNQSSTSTSATTFDWHENGAVTVNPAHHDIGLVFLASPITIASYPILAASPLANGATVTNVGRINNGTLTNQLYMANVTVTSAASIGYPYDYAANEIIQPGDSGGPDFAVGTHQIVAVNSGAGGGTEVLARVDLLHDWIQEQIAAHGGAGSSSSSSSSGGSSAPDGCPVDAEPNDTFNRASTLPAGSSCATLVTGNADWFAFDAAAGTFGVTLTTSGDAVFALGQVSAGSCVPSLTGLHGFSGSVATATRYCVLVTGSAQAYTLTRN